MTYRLAFACVVIFLGCVACGEAFGAAPVVPGWKLQGDKYVIDLDYPLTGAESSLHPQWGIPPCSEKYPDRPGNIVGTDCYGSLMPNALPYIGTKAYKEAYQRAQLEAIQKNTAKPQADPRDAQIKALEKRVRALEKRNTFEVFVDIEQGRRRHCTIGHYTPEFMEFCLSTQPKAQRPPNSHPPADNAYPPPANPTPHAP